MAIRGSRDGRALSALALAGGLALLSLAAAACGASKLPAPIPYAKQPTSALVVADYPPPPGRVEMVPEQPKDSAVWLDGEWVWQGGRWMWKQGRWVEPPAGATYSPWTGTRNALGTYYVAEGTWRDAKGTDLPDPPALAAAKTRAGTVVGADGEDVPQTPNVRPDNGRDGKERNRKDGGPPETPSGATPTGTEPKGGNRDAGEPPRARERDEGDADGGAE